MISYNAPNRLTLENLYPATRVSVEPVKKLLVPELDLQLRSSPRSDRTPAYLNELRGRMWSASKSDGLRTPSAVKKLLSIYGEFLKEIKAGEDDLSEEVTASLEDVVARRVESEWNARVHEAAVLGKYVSWHTVYASVLHVTDEHQVTPYVAQVVNFSARRNDTQMRVEPIIVGMDGQRGRLPATEVAPDIYEPYL